MSKSTTQTLDKGFFGHPKGLAILFFTEMWERFSYYGMRALLALYIMNELFKDDANAEDRSVEIYAAYGSLVYLAPIIGGYFSDKILGHKNAVKLGAILMCLGHFAMAFPQKEIFFIALGLLIVGNGFFKPNISSIVGSLYPQGDNRRESGFTIFYMGVNLGALLAPLVCGALSFVYGPHVGFTAAGVGMLVGYLVFETGLKKKLLGEAGLMPEEYREKKMVGLGMVPWFYIITIVVACTLVAWFIASGSAEIPGIGIGMHDGLMILLVTVVLSYIIFLMVKLGKSAAMKMGAIIVLTLFITLFWTFFELSGSALTIFASRNVDLWGWVNAEMTNSINPTFIVLFAPLLTMLWAWLDKKKKNPRTPIKSSIAIFLIGIGYLTFAASGSEMGIDGRVAMIYLIGGYFFMTIGELCISPIGLSKMTELAPIQFVAFFLGVFYLSSSFAHYLTKDIAKKSVVRWEEPHENDSGLVYDYASSFSGFDQNAVGNYRYSYYQERLKVLDTTMYKHVPIAEGSKDSTWKLDWEVINYPGRDEVNAYQTKLDSMSSMDNKWKSLSSELNEDNSEMLNNHSTLTAQTDTAYRKLYKQFINSYGKMASSASMKQAVDILKVKSGMVLEAYEDMSDKDLDLEYKNITQNYTKLAEKHMDIRNAMIAKDSTWAQAAFDFRDKLEENHDKVSSFVGMAQYTKVFSYIGVVCLIFGLFILIISPLVMKLMQDVH